MKHITAFLTLCACIFAAQAAPLMLVTQQEASASNNAPPTFTPKFMPEKDAPKIEVAAPNLTAPLASPTPIQMNFSVTSPATVKPETFKVLYGAFQIDVTQRLLSAAKVTAQGMNVQEASLPSGKHKLHLSVEDSMGRKGYRLVEFQIN
jgi:hypothetical protein